MIYEMLKDPIGVLLGGYEGGGGSPGGGGGGGSSGGWDIYRIKEYIAPESIVQSYSFNLTASGYYADEINGVYVRKTKDGFFDRYVNAEKGKVLLAICYIPDKLVEYSESLTDIRSKKWIIIDVKESDSYDSEDFDLRYAESQEYSDNAVNVAYWLCRAEGTGRFDPFYPSNSNYPISVNEWVPETIIGNRVVGYSGDTPSVESTDVELSGFQYSVESGKSYVVHDGYVIGHPCFMPDLRITLKMSGMDDFDVNANGIYTQNDFAEANQNSTWSNSKGYTIKYDYMMGQWACNNPSGYTVANGGYGDSPLGASWYEMVQWSGNEVTLELYTE